MRQFIEAMQYLLQRNAFCDSCLDKIHATVVRDEVV
jgi:hypothetical protein